MVMDSDFMHESDPQGFDRVLGDQSVGRDDGEAVFDGLANEHAVERVGVELGKFEELQDAGVVESQRANLPFRFAFGEKFGWRLRERQFPALPFQKHFPDGSRAQIALVRRIAQNSE